MSDNKGTEKKNAVTTEIAIIDEHTIRDMIYEVRGEKVMLDFELAEIYGYSTTAFNQQVKNNIEKFEGDDFCFYLTKEEFKNLISKKLTSSWGGRRKPPRAFTESGLYMLMTVLRGELATRQSRALIRAFRAMKDYIVETQGMITERDILRLSVQTAENTDAIRKLESEMATKDDLQKFMVNFSESYIGREFLILDGKMIEAEVAYRGIYEKAKKTIYIVDNYIGSRTLLLLREVPKKVKVIIFSDNLGYGKLTLAEFTTFQNEYPDVDITFKRTNGKFHDRFIVLDYKAKSEKIYHCGCSSKDAGGRTTAIAQSSCEEMYHPMVDGLLGNGTLRLR
ncbi:MAG: ORF6N domain-containing protein [Lachnospiraceae bacterium]|nr:ORF6N domain-containing protein [Lachnospiraceae bacterium]